MSFLTDTVLYNMRSRGIKEEASLLQITNDIEVISNNTLKIDGNLYIIDKSYPFGNIIINSYKIPTQNRFLSYYVKMMKTFDDIDKYYTILVFCHTREILLDNISTHFMINVFTKAIMEDPKYKDQEIVIYTVDIEKGGTFLDDAFSEKFTTFNYNHFNLIFIPDCAGKWYDLQCSSSADSFDEFDNLIINAKKLLKHGGIIWMSKFINENIVKNLEQKYGQASFTDISIDGLIDGLFLTKFLVLTKD